MQRNKEEMNKEEIIEEFKEIEKTLKSALVPFINGEETVMIVLAAMAKLLKNIEEDWVDHVAQYRENQKQQKQKANILNEMLCEWMKAGCDRNDFFCLLHDFEKEMRC